MRITMGGGKITKGGTKTGYRLGSDKKSNYIKIGHGRRRNEDRFRLVASRWTEKGNFIFSL